PPRVTDHQPTRGEGGTRGMRRLVAVGILGLGLVAGCTTMNTTTTPTGSKAALTEGPFRCTAKDSFGDAFSWTNFHKEIAMTNAYDMCRYRSQAPDSCKVHVSNCIPISQVPDHLDSLSDFRGGQ